MLTTKSGSAVDGRTVSFALGTGNGAQSCTAKTDGKGTASCAVRSVRQPLTADATVPVKATFGGDDRYAASSTNATVRLTYATGRAYGLSLSAGLPGLSVRLVPQPDTGAVRTADPTARHARCTATLDLAVAHAHAVCPTVTTATGTATATTTVSDVTVGLKDLPLVQISAVRATATARCDGTTGSATVHVTVGGVPVHVSTGPNSTVDLGDGLRLVVDEQVRGDGGLTVNAVHLTAASGAVDLVVGSATAAMHNCS